ncbi:MAG TPA: 2-dehydropantoate 2-reductase N-terminal domain-containing protein [Saprospiraceae bacterium]|nr:2-dehydropantoate 2-reductase N-terminal domain-containing protein [Saprospiraceae bacterium]HMQ84495.1 2-dehydropantoate 2-reductase N-terminal domain-containing protein [Saprospiraceae bacterium]
MKKPKLLLFGQGNIGTFVGAALQHHSDRLLHYVRHPHQLRESIHIQFNDRRKRPHKIRKGTHYTYSCITTLDSIAEFDYILLPLAHYHWKTAISTLLPLVREHQVLVLMGNFWDEMAWLETNMGQHPYIFAFPNFGGSITGNQIGGWLTPHFTVGVTNPLYQQHLQLFCDFLRLAGFRPRLEQDIAAWLKTHFAYNAGMMASAAKHDGFVKLTSSWSGLMDMYRLIRECMEVARLLGSDVKAFPEGRSAYKPFWWNTLTTRLIFLLPGLAKSIDAGKNLNDWWSYGKKVRETAQNQSLKTPLLDTFQDIWQTY